MGSRQPQEDPFEPTQEEQKLINGFGVEDLHAHFLDVMNIIAEAGIPPDRKDAVWARIRELRRANLGQSGKERVD